MEVLVTLFITAIGLLALLALFPVGALSMAKALKDSRCAQAAYNAAAISAALGISGDPNVSSQFSGAASGGTLPTVASLSGPSYPVYVDPIGVSLGSSTIGSALPRCSPSFNTSTATYLNWFTLADDFTFYLNGSTTYPTGATTSTAECERRYSWAYMFHQPVYQGGVVKTTIVVYSGRSSLVLGETTYTGLTLSAGNTITITPATPGIPPPLRNGGWILDATVTNSGAMPAEGPHGYFYRVVGITDNGDGTYQLELETPLRLTTSGAYGVVVLMDNVAEVFDR
jgi:hypothetical protein